MSKSGLARAVSRVTTTRSTFTSTCCFLCPQLNQRSSNPLRPTSFSPTLDLGQRTFATSSHRRARVLSGQKDHYATLGVSREASKREVKNKFYELSKKSHPDIPGGDRTKFEAVAEAYGVLGDDAKRRQYDLSNYPSRTSSSSSSSSSYSSRSPYLRRDRDREGRSGPHRAWSSEPSGSTTQARNSAYPEYHYPGGGGRRYPFQPPPSFGSSSHHFPAAGSPDFLFTARTTRLNASLGGKDRHAASPDADEGVRNESGVARFIGVVAVLMVIIGLGGGFTVRADDGRSDEDAGQGTLERRRAAKQDDQGERWRDVAA